MTTAETSTAEWSFAKKLGFRFLFCYLALYFFPIPSGLSGPEWLSGIFDKAWQKIVPWVAGHILHVPIPIFSNGSGDTTYDYVRVLCMAVMAISVAILWSLRSRRTEHTELKAWSWVWLRYALAVSMLTFGFMKVIKVQFITPYYGRLLEPYGQSSPMGLLWTFMGYSTPYTFFTGFAEVIGGFLLFFRRTTTLGLLIVIAVMGNVVMLNLCYDIPVKLGSMHILMLAVILIWPELGRLLGFLVLNRPTRPADLEPSYPRPWMRKVSLGLKTLVILAVLGNAVVSNLDHYRASQGQDAEMALYMGLPLKVTSFSEDGRLVPVGEPNPERWVRVLGHRMMFRVWLANGTSEAFKLKYRDGGMDLLPLDATYGQPIEGAQPAGRLPVDFLDWSHGVTLSFRGHEVKLGLALEHLDPARFPLMNRGFHWIQETPNNR